MTDRDHRRELIPLITTRPRHLADIAAQLGISEIVTATALGWLKLHNYVVYLDGHGYIATPTGIAWQQENNT
ncbi:hypothetical protein FK530_18970 [Tsukamurella conjunctivitidis]|uniref:Winged helix-turn-helix domain-containing protein n=1 Tax=Tsukamurella conjunctivitidis TaxID=2592068 RepID=A0A5C5RYW6_9ACTN|nr:hypothetical protein [Tsukamurella conjunctivitidis]TWS27405.1 hypothetical protein FK530_18970 [Tsukamurella conjunctivitidis]